MLFKDDVLEITVNDEQILSDDDVSKVCRMSKRIQDVLIKSVYNWVQRKKKKPKYKVVIHSKKIAESVKNKDVDMFFIDEFLGWDFLHVNIPVCNYDEISEEYYDPCLKNLKVYNKKLTFSLVWEYGGH